jgi:hypothetical protein
MKSNIFDFNRFGLLVRKRLLDSKSSTIYEVLGLAAVFAVIFGLAATTGVISSKMQLILFSIGLVVLGIIYADRAFTDVKGKIKGMAFLATPASHLEKLLNAIFYTSVLFPIVFLLVFLAVDGLFYVGLNATGLVKMEAISLIGTNELSNFIRPMLIAQSAYMLGSIWFGKRSLLKTTLAIVLFYGILAAVGGIIIRINYEALRAFSENSQGIHLNLGPDEFKMVGVEYLLWLVPPFFWTVTYFRLSEKQI